MYLIEAIVSLLPEVLLIILNLKDAFWQIPLVELYQCVFMIGLCNTAHAMQLLVVKAIPAQLRYQIFVLLDDFLLFTEIFD